MRPAAVLNRKLIRENPVRGSTFKVPREKNPRRPVAARERYERLRAVSDHVPFGRCQPQRSYLRELLDLAYGTGRRISAIRQLTYADLLLTQGPHGSIRWPAATDKLGHESVVPFSPLVRAALDCIRQERPGIGSRPLFPDPKDATRAIPKYRLEAWLRQAEKLAGLEKQEGGLWHAFRRGWATARKHLPAQDVARAGGWKAGSVTLLEVYQ